MKKIFLFLIVVTFISGISGCSTLSQKPTTNPRPDNSDKNIVEGNAASTIDKAANSNNSDPAESLSPTGTPTPSNNEEVQIGFVLNSYMKDDIPCTDVYFKIQWEKQEENIFIGSYLGNGSVIESFENRAFFNLDSITGCQIFHAGGGDNFFAYLENSEIKVKHIEFVLGNEDIDSEIITEEVVITREIPKNSTIITFEKDIATPTSITESQNADNPDKFVSTSFSDTTDDYSYSIPKININSDDVIVINKEIQDKYKNEVDEEIKNYKQGYSVSLLSLKYDVIINDTILSLLITKDCDFDFIVYQTYNVDISTGKILSNIQLLQYKNITEADLLNELPNLLSDEFIMQNRSKDTVIENMKKAPDRFTEEEIEDFSKEYTDKYNLTIDKSNFGIDMPMFLDSDGNLNIIAKIYSLAGANFYYQIMEVH